MARGIFIIFGNIFGWIFRYFFFRRASKKYFRLNNRNSDILDLYYIWYSELIVNKPKQKPYIHFKNYNNNFYLFIFFSKNYFFFFRISEFYLEKYYIHPLKFIGIQGLWGILIMTIVLPIINFIPCDYPDICVKDYDGKMYLERFNIFFD
jgi:hypothetical protein